MNNKYISVSVLNSYLHNIFVAEELLHNISVCGEVSGIKISRSHAYFTLKDANSQISCCSFNCAKTYIPKEGESVIITGYVDFYEKGGRLSLNADNIVPYGAGLLAMKLELLKQKLSEEGLFDEAHKIKLMQYPMNVCVLTSTSGAVIKDIITTVRKVNSLINISVYDVQVQGENCARSIVKALKIVDKLGFDAIIIARGGGSAEDIMPFNDEFLVRAIYQAKTCIISAVGHETDFTLCDFVSDYRCPTPTAAAQLIAFNQDELIEYVNQFNKKAISIMQYKTELMAKTYSSLNSRLIAVMKEKYSHLSKESELFDNKLLNLWKNKYNYWMSLIGNSLTKLSAYNPAEILKKGFFSLSCDGKKIVGVSSLQKGDCLTLASYDGCAEVVVEKINKV